MVSWDLSVSQVLASEMVARLTFMLSPPLLQQYVTSVVMETAKARVIKALPAVGKAIFRHGDDEEFRVRECEEE